MLTYSRLQIKYACIPVVRYDASLVGLEIVPLNNDSYHSGGLPDDRVSALAGLLEMIVRKENYFIRNNLLVAVKVDFNLASGIVSRERLYRQIQRMPYLRLEINERFPNLNDGTRNALVTGLKELCPLWLDDFASGHASLSAVTGNMFEFVKINEHFFREQCRKDTFPVLLNNINRYCQGVIVNCTHPVSPGETGTIRHLYNNAGTVARSIMHHGGSSLTRITGHSVLTSSIW